RGSWRGSPRGRGLPGRRPCSSRGGPRARRRPGGWRGPRPGEAPAGRCRRRPAGRHRASSRVFAPLDARAPWLPPWHARPWHRRPPPPPAASGGLRSEASVHQPVTRPLGDVHPGVPLGVPLRGPGARRVRGLAVVLAGLGDPVALLVIELGGGPRTALRPGEDGAAEGGRHGRGDEQGRGERPLHRSLPPIARRCAGAVPRPRARSGRLTLGALDSGAATGDAPSRGVTLR